MDIISPIKKFFKKVFSKRSSSSIDKYTKEYLEYFDRLFFRAARTSGFDYLYTLLRIEGITSGHWDAFVEAEEAAMDFSEMLRNLQNKKGKEKRSLRLGLLLYCHSTEMSAPYEILANLLRCCQEQPYKFRPFSHLATPIGKQGFFGKSIPPSPSKKIKHIRELAQRCGEDKLLELVDGFFRNQIRNAFYHSDYTITETKFRIIEGGNPVVEEIDLEELSDALAKCFAFYSAFFITYKNARKAIGMGRKYHTRPNFEVVEILTNSEGLLSGFKIHFPSGTSAFFERKDYEGTRGLNLMIEKEGISLHVGDLEKYQMARSWMVDGKPFEQTGTRYNEYGYWRPIVLHRHGEMIESDVSKMTEDHITRGALFYIYATGHLAVEFIIKSKDNLFKGDVYRRPSKGFPYIEIKHVLTDKEDHVYDGTLFLNSRDTEAVKTGIEILNDFVNKLKNEHKKFVFSLKYEMYKNASKISTMSNSDTVKNIGTIIISMEDPTSTLFTSNLSIFPKQDWSIKPEWIN